MIAQSMYGVCPDEFGGCQIQTEFELYYKVLSVPDEVNSTQVQTVRSRKMIAQFIHGYCTDEFG